MTCLPACGGGSHAADAGGGASDGAVADGAAGADGAPGSDGGGSLDGGGGAEAALYYWGDFDQNDVYQVGRVVLSTDEQTTLSLSGLSTDAAIDAVAVSPSGEIAVAGRNTDGDLLVNLYPADGSGAPTTLVTGTRGDENVSALVFSPDGSRLALVADLALNKAAALYVVPVDGGAGPTLLSHSPAADQRVARLLWADADHIVFAGDTAVDQVTGVYSVDVTSPGTPTELVPMDSLADGQDLRDLLGVDDAGRVYFAGNYEVAGTFRIYRADLDGQNLEQVPGTHVDDGDGREASVGSFALSPDGKTLAFSAGAPDPKVHRVYVMDLSGSSPVLVSDVGADTPASDFTGPTEREPLVFSPGATRLAAASDWQIGSGDTQNTFAAFVLPVAAPAGGVRVVKPADNASDVDQIAFAADSRLVVLGDLLVHNDAQLYLLDNLSAADQDPSAVLLQDVPAGSGDVAGFALSP